MCKLKDTYITKNLKPTKTPNCYIIFLIFFILCLKKLIYLTSAAWSHRRLLRKLNIRHKKGKIKNN